MTVFPARAVLALTRPECINPDLPAHERAKVTTWQAEVLERVDVTSLPGYLRNRVQMRRASVWGAAAYQQARKNASDPAVAAAADAQRMRSRAASGRAATMLTSTEEQSQTPMTATKKLLGM